MFLGREIKLAVGGPRHSLWGHLVWNGSKRLAMLLETGALQVQGKRVLELGAGACLLSICSAMKEARRVVCSDYPDPDLLASMRLNIEENLGPKEKEKIASCGFRWGDTPSPLLEANSGEKFDLILLGDLLFNHTELRKLAKSVSELLSDNGLVFNSFSHYRPLLKNKDLQFFDYMAGEGFSSSLLDKTEMQLVHDSNTLREVFTFVHQRAIN